MRGCARESSGAGGRYAGATCTGGRTGGRSVDARAGRSVDARACESAARARAVPVGDARACESGARARAVPFGDARTFAIYAARGRRCADTRGCIDGCAG